MSFSIEIKEELCRIRLRRNDCRLSELAGITQTCGSLRISRTPSVIYQSESSAVIRRAALYAGALYTLDITMGMREQAHRKRPLSVATLIGEDCRKLLVDTGTLTETADGISFDKHILAALIADEEQKRCFMRGAFLGAGSCSNPSRGYHLEIAAHTQTFADALCNLIGEFYLSAKTTERKGRLLIYLKGEDVAGFLALIGASKAALRFEDVRTEKDFRNHLNRKNNCETANLDKTITAGLMQIMAIERIEEHMSLSDLPAPLYEAARLRLQYPDATLQELADRAEIGKSGMNHRFARLLAIARDYEE